MKKIIILFIAAACVLAAAAVCARTFEITKSFYDKPEPDAGGGIAGKVVGDAPLFAVAYEPVANMIYMGEVRGDTFRFTNLPPGRYDLLLKFRTHVLEGIRLDIWGVDEELPSDDLEQIHKIIGHSEAFFNEKTILRHGGSDEERLLIVEQIRTGLTWSHAGHSTEDRLIRRIDISRMKKGGGKMWQLVNTRFFFREERLNEGPGTRISYAHDKRLSAIRVGGRMVQLRDIVLGEKEE